MKEKKFDPAKSEYICSISADGHTRIYRSRITGKFFKCSVSIVEKADPEISRPLLRLLSANDDTPEPWDITANYEVSDATVSELELSEAEKLLETAVMDGMLSPLVFAKHFGEHAEKKIAVSALIPAALKQHVEWSGLTFEKLIEKGCNAQLTEVQSSIGQPQEDF